MGPQKKPTKHPLHYLELVLNKREFGVWYYLLSESRNDLPCDYCETTKETKKTNLSVFAVFENGDPILLSSEDGKNVTRKMNEIFLTSLVSCPVDLELLHIAIFTEVRRHTISRK